VKLSIDTRPTNQRELLLSLRGEIDYESAQELRAAVTSAVNRNVDTIVINLADVTFIDSTGIGTLVVARRICHGCGVNLHIQEANPFIARLFAVVGVSDVLGVPVPAGAQVMRLPQGRVQDAAQPV
jgi:anti-sigma B factor antagonist